MTVLHISIATSSLIKRNLPEESRQQPWIVRLSAALCDDDGEALESFSCGIRAEGRIIETAATRIHGISTNQAQRTGCYEFFALGMVCGLKANGGRRTTDYPGLASNARYVVGWDVEFIRTVIGSLFARHGEPGNAWIRPGLTFIDLQQTARLFCKLPCPEGDDSGQFKTPTRDEAAAELLDAPPRALPHTTDSNLDVERTIYAVLKERKAFDVEAVA